MPGSYNCFNCMYIKVKARLGHPCQPVMFLSGSSGFGPVYKTFGWILHWIICVNNGICTWLYFNLIGSDLGYYPSQWIIWISDVDPVSTLMCMYPP